MKLPATLPTSQRHATCSSVNVKSCCGDGNDDDDDDVDDFSTFDGMFEETPDVFSSPLFMFFFFEVMTTYDDFLKPFAVLYRIWKTISPLCFWSILWWLLNNGMSPLYTLSPLIISLLFLFILSLLPSIHGLSCDLFCNEDFMCFNEELVSYLRIVVIVLTNSACITNLQQPVNPLFANDFVLINVEQIKINKTSEL